MVRTTSKINGKRYTKSRQEITSKNKFYNFKTVQQKQEQDQHKKESTATEA
jgi:hypothetical protein